MLDHTLRVSSIVTATLVMFAAAPSFAEDQGGALPMITGNGACPAAETISATIGSLIPGGAEALPRSAKVEVIDLGDSYRVTLVTEGKERVRLYRDVSRDCDQRARFVAVFIVLTLMPPELLAESPMKAPPPSPLPPPAAVPTVVAAIPAPPSPRRFRLEVAATMDLAPAIADTPAIVSPGAEIRFAGGGKRLAVTAGVGIQPGASFSVAGLEARELRVPFDVGARARALLGPVELAAEAGIGAALFHAEGVNPVAPAGGTRLDVGARGAVAVRFGSPSARLAPAISVHALYFPRPYEIGTTPSGVVGHMPSLWLGGTAGASMSF